MNENSTQPTTTRAEEMLTAAKRIRDTAAKATRGPWIYYPTIRRHEDAEGAEYAWTVGRSICENDDSPCTTDCGADVLRTGAEDCDEDFVRVEDVEWMTLVNPLLAEPLATWLEREALWARDHDGMPRDLEALHAARAINGTSR